MKDAGAGEVGSLARRVAARYGAAPRFDRIYVGMKLRGDPLTQALLAHGRVAPFGDVLDLGCGRGQFSLAVLDMGLARSAHGIDWNTRHIGMGRIASAGIAFAGERRDLSEPCDLPVADTIFAFDLLYQLRTDAQAGLIARMAEASRSRILIRTADPAWGWRGRVTRWAEQVGRPFWPNSGAHVNAHPLAWIADQLDQAGFEAASEPCSRGTPFANVLIVARRR